MITMTLEESFEVLESFAVANQLDSLTAMEVMAKNYRKLSNTERQAIGVFLDASKGVVND